MEINDTIEKQINAIKDKCQLIKPLVVVWCITYNHELYLRDALEGFIMQKTNYPFVAVVHDDLSTDGTSEILKEYAEKYPNLILPIFEIENQYSKGGFNVIFNILRTVLKASCAKYVAFCEGDDYWTDPLKLQKQVYFLETNSDYGLIYTMSTPYKQKLNEFGKPFGGGHERLDLMVYDHYIPTATVMITSNSYFEFFSVLINHPEWRMVDYPMFLWFSCNSKIKFIPESTGVYRIQQNSTSHFNNYIDLLDFRINATEIIRFFTDKYNKNLSIVPQQRKAWLEYEKALLSGTNIPKYFLQLKLENAKPNNIKEKLMYYSNKLPWIYKTLWESVRLFKKLKYKFQ